MSVVTSDCDYNCIELEFHYLSTEQCMLLLLLLLMMTMMMMIAMKLAEWLEPCPATCRQDAVYQNDIHLFNKQCMNTYFSNTG